MNMYISTEESRGYTLHQGHQKRAVKRGTGISKKLSDGSSEAKDCRRGSYRAVLFNNRGNNALPLSNRSQVRALYCQS